MITQVRQNCGAGTRRNEALDAVTDPPGGMSPWIGSRQLKTKNPKTRWPLGSEPCS